MFSKFLIHLINARIKLLHFFGSHRFAEQIKLFHFVLAELEEYDSGRSVQNFLVEDFIEMLPGDVHNVAGDGRRPGEFHFDARIAEILQFQKKGALLGGKIVPPQFDAGIFDIL